MSQKAFQYIKDRRKFLNISSIEQDCEITRTSLLNAINRNQKSFGQSDKLIEFLNSFFSGWDSD
jgi:CRISPR/Cas system CSM-associated protein Csm2 small subunit